MKKSRFWAVLVLLPLLFACDLLEKNGGVKPSSVSVSFKAATGDSKADTGDSKAGRVFVVANSIAEWTLELDFGGKKPWATPSHTSGKGYKSNILLSYEKNDGNESRTVRIILTSAGLTAEAVFTQNSKQQEKHDYGADFTKCGWLELPETKAGDGMEWFCHHFNHNGVTKRNYSFYYSYDDYVSLWVAYPLNSSLKGSGTRPKQEPWAYDDLLPNDKQIYVKDGGISGYTRGHQLPSADRYSGDSNAQTYYSTNITPQLYNFNTVIWLNVENTVRNWALDGKADTLYVVTGCTVAGSTKKATDYSGHSITVPTAYWKACLRNTRSSGWTACGIWLEHTNTSATSITRDDLYSIDELEEKIGIDLFVNLPGRIKAEKAKEVEAKKPDSISWPI